MCTSFLKGQWQHCIWFCSAQWHVDCWGFKMVDSLTGIQGPTFGPIHYSHVAYLQVHHWRWSNVNTLDPIHKIASFAHQPKPKKQTCLVLVAAHVSSLFRSWNNLVGSCKWPKFARFWKKKIYQSPEFLLLVLVGSQKYKKDFDFFLLPY